MLRLSGGDDGERLLRMSGGREYGDDDYDGGATVSLAAVAQEARERERETTTSNNAAAESAAARAGGGGGGEKGTGSGNGGRGSGALLTADAFRKQHDISIRKLGSRAGCEQLEPLQSFGKVLDTYYLNVLICPSLHRHRPTPYIHQYIYIYICNIHIYRHREELRARLPRNVWCASRAGSTQRSSAPAASVRHSTSKITYTVHTDLY